MTAPWLRIVPEGETVRWQRLSLRAVAMVFTLAVLLPACLCADQSRGWVLQNSATTQALNGVADNGTLFVAVGDAGTILTSPDAHTWSPQASPTKQNLNGVTWFRDRFIAVGNNGVILLSPDGVSWTGQDSHTSSNLRGIAAGPATLVAVGDQGVILFSLKGEAWATITAARSPPIRSNRAGFTISRPSYIHVLGTTHGFIIPAGDHVLISTDGRIWTATSVIPGRDPFASGPTSRVPMKNAGTPATNGTAPLTPTRRGRPPLRGRAGSPARASAAPESLTAVAQSDNFIVAVSDIGGIWTYPKGGRWIPLDKPLPNNFTDKLSDVYWSGRHFLAVGGNGTVASSIDGLHWQKIPVPLTQSLVAVSSRLGLFVAVGANGAILTGDDLPRVAQPSIAPAGGLFTSRPLVTLDCPTSGAVLFYTTDGTEPTENSAVYGGPFPMPKPGTLRVCAFKAGMDASKEVSAVFHLPVLPVIIQSPESVRVPFLGSGQMAGFEVTESGGYPAPAYQWQIKPPNSDVWANYSGNDPKEGRSKTLLVEYVPSMSGAQFRCMVSNMVGDVFSADALLTVFIPKPAVIEKQPEEASVPLGQSATFYVIASGDPKPKYGWELFNKKTGKWDKLRDDSIYSGTQSPTLVVKSTTKEMRDDMFRCKVSNGYPLGDPPLITNTAPLSFTDFSSAAVLTVKK